TYTHTHTLSHTHTVSHTLTSSCWCTQGRASLMRVYAPRPLLTHPHTHTHTHTHTLTSSCWCAQGRAALMRVYTPGLFLMAQPRPQLVTPASFHALDPPSQASGPPLSPWTRQNHTQIHGTQ